MARFVADFRSRGGQGRGRSPEPPAKVPRRSVGAAQGGWADIDGSILEGGGQIVRMSSAYAAIFGRPVKISKIRAGRKTPGLAAQHLESLRLVRDVSSGDLSNDFVRSESVTLVPKKLSPGNFNADPGTAGAITLMVQASLFPLIMAGGRSCCDLKGGTDVSFSPPLDFVTGVLQPTALRMGAEFQVECLIRGFNPKGGGRVRLTVPECPGPLRPIDLSVRGDPKRVTARLYSTRALAGEERREAETLVRRAVSALAADVRLECCTVPSPNYVEFKPLGWVDLLVETTSGSLFHAGSEPKALPPPNAGRSAGPLLERAASDASFTLAKQLKTGAAVDEHLLDQLILPASLAAGKSRLLAAKPSLHTATALHIAQYFLPELRVTQTRRGELTLLEIEGVGWPPPASEAPSQGGAKASRPAAGTKEVLGDLLQLSSQTGAVVTPELFPLRAGDLSRAPAALHKDFAEDLRQLSDLTGAAVTADAPKDQVVLLGTAEARGAARAHLSKIAGFYFP